MEKDLAKTREHTPPTTNSIYDAAIRGAFINEYERATQEVNAFYKVCRLSAGWAVTHMSSRWLALLTGVVLDTRSRCQTC